MNIASDLTTYGRDLHRFLDRLPAQLKNANTPESAGQIAELERGCERLLREAPRPDPTARWAQAWSKVQMRLSELNQALRTFKTQDIAQVRSLTKSKALAREYVLAHYTETARAYEAWLMQWSTPAQQRPQSLRTLRAARTWFHIAMGVFAAVMYQFVIDKTQALIILYTLGGIFGTLEVTRRFSQRWNEILVSTVFKAISRPGEFHKTNSATYYLFALCFITTFFDRAAVITGILVLAFGDPAAAWVGKRFGKLKIYREKSLVGALAFFAAASIVTLTFFFSLHPEMAVSTRIFAALAAAAVGAIAEVFSTRLDDNLTVPVAVVAITTLIL